MVYFAVDDADAAATLAGRSGGRVQQPPFDSPHGRIAVLADPGGALFGVLAP
jgi:predicted enzyme related to lactoylglutathione lyase